MSFFLPIASCWFFLSSYSPLLLHPLLNVDTPHLLSFSDSLTCPSDSTPPPHLFYAHFFRLLPVGHPPERCSFPSHFFSLLRQTCPVILKNKLHSLFSHLFILFSIAAAAHLLFCFHVKFIDSATRNYFSSVLSGFLPGWLSSLPTASNCSQTSKHPMTAK